MGARYPHIFQPALGDSSSRDGAQVSSNHQLFVPDSEPHWTERQGEKTPRSKGAGKGETRRGEREGKDRASDRTQPPTCPQGSPRAASSATRGYTEKKKAHSSPCSPLRPSLTGTWTLLFKKWPLALMHLWDTTGHDGDCGCQVAALSLVQEKPVSGFFFSTSIF